MDNDELNELLTEIFGPDAGLSGAATQHAKMSPSLADIIEFAKLLKGEQPERVFQKFLTKHPEFLAGVAGEGRQRHRRGLRNRLSCHEAGLGALGTRHGGWARGCPSEAR